MRMAGSANVENVFSSVGEAAQANLIRAAGDTFGSMQPSASPMASEATIVRIRLV
jgi:hypothetical protein